MTLQRDLYLASRTVGDLNALQKGTIVPHIIKRYYHRFLINLLRKGGIW